ncbi:MAG: bifunctional hydroxymethylpyrimidine kinase/phosphomethylpyrimidine kinase [candidate division NC10 bacterium]|jgi:hydroxymethylpyrimidine/phosphomethylpyrimidine kinase|nr:bifunctional hydroxymethylpyrimidine kinase/phosphomethylpyrimidine kinase [candidate division NC10 bacterium]
MRRALTIAGSDSGGGAGIQADLKTFTAFQVYGLSVLTAITAQNTLGVQGVETLPPDFVTLQIRSVLSDIGADAGKTGMLATKEIVAAVAEGVREFQLPNLVVDPVMVSATGHRLLDEDAVEAVKTLLFPLATVVTPNLDEATILWGEKVKDLNGMKEAAKAIKALGPRYVLVKGGHLSGPKILDVLYDGKRFEVWDTPKIPTEHTHGSGCTISAAIAAGLAKGHKVKEAVDTAQRYIHAAIRTAVKIGKGKGPVNHLAKVEGSDVQSPTSQTDRKKGRAR